MKRRKSSIPDFRDKPGHLGEHRGASGQPI
jgi:hypothetical protein